MNRDHILYLGAGLMIGFVLAYLAYENIGSKQPQRRVPGQAQTAPQGGNPGGNPAAGLTPEQVEQLVAYVEQNPEDAQAVLALGNLYFDRRQWERAAQRYEQYLGLQPENPDILSDLGVCYRGMQQFDRALEVFQRAQELDPDHWESRFNQVIVLAGDLRDFDAAEATLDELRRIRPDDADVERLASQVERLREGGA